MADRFCELCDCDGTENLGFVETNFHCPLLGGKICGTCCQAEIMGGMGAPDTFKELCKKSERTPQEAHAACVACPNGGPELNELPKAIYIKPGAEEENEEFEQSWQERLDWLNRKEKEKESDGTEQTDRS
jgi:hypothetical protein